VSQSLKGKGLTVHVLMLCILFNDRYEYRYGWMECSYIEVFSECDDIYTYIAIH